MRYLTEIEFDKINDTVTISPLSEIDDISRYFFDPGTAKEYEIFLKEEAPELDRLCISRTFVFFHKFTNELIGYLSLSTDTVKLTETEKEKVNLEDVKFMSLPAVKVGKLAVNKGLSEQSYRKGYGSFMLAFAGLCAYEVNQSGVACRFLTVDADIEYDKNTPVFYEKNGFERNLSIKQKPSSKTVSMRKDIFSPIFAEQVI